MTCSSLRCCDAMTVVRYKLIGYDRGIEPAHDGGFISFSDYEAVVAERDDARNYAKELRIKHQREMDKLRSMIDKQARELLEASRTIRILAQEKKDLRTRNATKG